MKLGQKSTVERQNDEIKSLLCPENRICLKMHLATVKIIVIMLKKTINYSLNTRFLDEPKHLNDLGYL